VGALPEETGPLDDEVVGGFGVPARGLRLETWQVENTKMMSVSGEIDVLTSPSLGAALDAALAGPGAGPVIVDMTGVVFLALRGLQVMVSATEHAVRRGRGLRFVVADNHHMLRLIEMTGMASVLELYPTLDDAQNPPDSLRF
jgi:anti-sigma B factor antagonist